MRSASEKFIPPESGGLFLLRRDGQIEIAIADVDDVRVAAVLHVAVDYLRADV